MLLPVCPVDHLYVNGGFVPVAVALSVIGCPAQNIVTVPVGLGGCLIPILNVSTPAQPKLLYPVTIIVESALIFPVTMLVVVLPSLHTYFVGFVELVTFSVSFTPLHFQFVPVITGFGGGNTITFFITCILSHIPYTVAV